MPITDNSQLPPIFIVGPTASGKSQIAAELANHLGGHVYNADAYQVYRNLEILTAAPNHLERQQAPHHLFSIIPTHQNWDAHQHLQNYTITRKKQHHLHPDARPIITGGSGLYLKFLSHGPSNLPPADPTLRAELDQLSLEQLVKRLTQLDPHAAAHTPLDNRRYVTRNLEICILTGKKVSTLNSPQWRPPLREGVKGFYLQWPPEQLQQRIKQRTQQLLQTGAIDEVTALKPTTLSTTAAKAIGLAQIQQLIAGEINHSQCLEQIIIATRQYAKRQRTWFKRERSWLTPVPITPQTTPNQILKIILKQI